MSSSKSLLEGIDHNEKVFQEKMRRIYEKYNNAFEDDVVVNIFDFTYSTSDGSVPWDFGTGADRKLQYTRDKTPEREEHSTFIDVFATDSSSDSLEDDLNTTRVLSKESSDGNFSRTFIVEDEVESKESDPDQLEYEQSCTIGKPSQSIKLSAGTKETCISDGHSKALMSHTGSYIGNKTFFVSPLETSVSMHKKSFIRRPNTDCSFEDIRDVSYDDSQVNENKLQNYRESAYCDAGDTSLAHYYPDMVECIRRLWELPWKKRAADNIVQYYKRHVWNAQKKLYTKHNFHNPSHYRRPHLHPLRETETIKGCSRFKHTLNNTYFKISSSMESAVQRSGYKTFSVNSNKYGSNSPITLSNFLTKQNKVDIPEIGSCMKEQNGQLSVRGCMPVKNIRSIVPLIHRPKAMAQMASSSVDDTTMILEKTFTYQNRIETNDVNSSSHRSNVSQLSKMPSVLAESSFSAFPVLSPRKNILSSSIGSGSTISCKSFSKQDQVESFKTQTFSNKEQNRQTFMYKEQPETPDVNSFPENVRCFPKLTSTQPRTSPGKHNVMLKCKTYANNTSWDNTFTCKNSVKVNEVKPFNVREQDRSPSHTSSLINKSPGKHSSITKYRIDPSNTSLDNTFTFQNSMEVSNIKHFDVKEQEQQPSHTCALINTSSIKQGINFKYRINLDNTSLGNTSTNHNSVKVNDIKEQVKQPSHACALIKRNSFSAFPLIRNPKNNPKSFHSFNETTTYQEDLKTVDLNASRQQELARPNSVSALPVVYNFAREDTPDMMFEGIYRKENLSSSYPNLRVQSSEMVWSLVNSPGSRRSKRQPSRNLSFSTFKRQKSADETFIKSICNSTHHSEDQGSVLWQGTKDYSPKSSAQTKRLHFPPNGDRKHTEEIKSPTQCFRKPSES